MEAADVEVFFQIPSAAAASQAAEIGQWKSTEEQEELLLDKHSKHFCFIEDLVKLSSNSQPQPVPSCSRG